jgi:hypothetical protein
MRGIKSLMAVFSDAAFFVWVHTGICVLKVFGVIRADRL